MDTKEKVGHDVAYDSNGSSGGKDRDFETLEPPTQRKLTRDLKGRHMQMIAIGMFSKHYEASFFPDLAIDSISSQVVQLVLVCSSVLEVPSTPVGPAAWYVHTPIPKPGRKNKEPIH